MRKILAVILSAMLLMSFSCIGMAEGNEKMDLLVSEKSFPSEKDTQEKALKPEALDWTEERLQPWTGELQKVLKETKPAVDGRALSKNKPDEIITIADAELEFEQGSKATQGDIKVVNLQGTWRQMGRQYGYLMKEELQELIVFLDIIMEAKEGNTEMAQFIVDQQTAQTPYRISEFFEGAAETSGLTVEQLQTVNAVERIGGLPRCSVAMAWDEYAASDLVIGRNYDYSESFALLKDAIAVTVYHPADGALATATIGYVGEIYAVNGINEKGIFLELNNGKPSANIKSPDSRITGTTMLFECLFEADDLSDMELFFNTVNCSSSYIINVADEKEGQSFEWCPIGVKHGDEELPEGLLVSTNYFVNPDWLFAVPSDEASWSGLTRRNNLINLCEEQKGELDESKMMEIMNRTVEEGGAKNKLTVYQIVFTPKEKSLWLKITGGSDWTRIDLNSFLES